MSEMSYIYIGLIVVGIGLTLKIVKEGLHDMDVLQKRMVQFRKDAELYHSKTAEEEMKGREFEELVEEAKREVKDLDDKEKLGGRKILALKEKLERGTRTKHKVDLFE